MAGDEGYPRRVNEPAPHRRPRYPGAHLDIEDDSPEQLRREAPRCHIFPPKEGTRVMTQGVFDLVHLGHLHYLQAAKDLGDELVVVVARDETVERNKHAPIFNEEARRELIAALGPVDSAVLGHRGDFYRIVEEIDPDIICIGYDQPYKEEAIEEECRRRGLHVKVHRLPHMDYDLDSTRKVVEAIGRRLARRDLYKGTARPAQKSLREVGVPVDEHEQDKDEDDTGNAVAERVNLPRETPPAGTGGTETKNKDAHHGGKDGRPQVTQRRGDA